MNTSKPLDRAMRHQRGAVIIIVAASMVAILGFAAICVDVGYLIYTQRRLQAATDAAALAGAADLWSQPWNTAYNDAVAYSAGQANQLPGGATVNSTSVTGLTLTSIQLPYKQALSGYNGIQVTQKASVTSFFASVFGVKATTVSATSTAAAGGAGGPAQYNVMIILDTTASMNTNDSNCKNSAGVVQTRLACAKAAALQLIETLTNAGDNVGLMAFPPMSSNYSFSCGSSAPSIAGSYSAAASAGYQYSKLGTGFLGSSGQANTSSGLVQALGGGSCSGLAAPGGLGTYYAQAIAAAQQSLQTLSSTQLPPGQNVIILLSDGDASSSQTQLGSTYKSNYGTECQAAINTAATAKGAGTLIYTVAYIGGGSASSTCSDGSDPLSPCATMKSIASGPAYFYSDTCSGSNGGTANLKSIFSTISYSLTKPRLIPASAT
ncbi:MULTISPECIES: vWA domain-containing protein [Burkholderia]|uniref:VWA domain-containing protein n=1 Tax=Burkholderia anthina TaxID=179879 RepID=A0A7T7AL28_9BURK|nr:MULTISPECIES: VWA domain-containing protein [Burkholderia]MBY4865160.1 VWA domain-containing protein [Burkholderia anthina]QQK06630.1 VWA domain-containing protein [Burkholderia anthina]